MKWAGQPAFAGKTKRGRVTLFGGMNQRWIIASVGIVLFVPQ